MILIAGAIYLISQTGSFNSFIMALLLIAFIICSTSFFSFCCTNKAPTALMIANILLVFILKFVLIIGFCIVFVQDKITEFLVQQMKDSEAVIREVKEKINSEMDLTKIVMLSYSIIIVRNLFKISFWI
jgi:hypothetical protein